MLHCSGWTFVDGIACSNHPLEADRVVLDFFPLLVESQQSRFEFTFQRRHRRNRNLLALPPNSYHPPYALRTPVCRPGVSGPSSVHRIVAQISGRIPNPKNTGVYEYRSTTHPVISVKSMPPNPDPMLARP